MTEFHEIAEKDKFEEDEFIEERRKMVREHLIKRGIKSKRVLAAMLSVPRHKFIPDELKKHAYDDNPLPIGYGQTISQPFIVALMTECLLLRKEDKVLEIGTGSGYQTAILAELAKIVYSVEQIQELAEEAKKRLKNYNNVKIFVGNGSLGLPEYAPYDKIIVTAAAPEIPEPLKQQLKDEGILVIPKGDRFIQSLLVVRKYKDRFQIEDKGGCVFVPLIGKYGFKERE